MTEHHFKRILIANRGEIALRVMRTCQTMGILTVGVYSSADVRAPHVRFADEAVQIGPPAARDSYLNIDSIIDAARRTQADAIHPGYGFLSENADFAEACEAAGVVFIGPTSSVIRSMGLKSAARRIVAAAGVSIVPGYDGEDQSTDGLTRNAAALGLPMLIKASAGGGGKGMRIVRNASELKEAIEASRREADKAFGDDKLLLEKYIENARHVEIQILGDEHGKLIHLFERECSIQRRHQKVIEESPSSGVNSELRDRICDAAIEAGRAIGYTNAGTVEFILSPSGEFFFIEVNTRLQVEHPVTEMITGLDLVQLQIEIAEGRTLSISQAEIKQRGHAIEARLYAEDPSNGFLPATGVLKEWRVPVSIRGLRVDAGVEPGMEIGIHYDPMLAKMIARGPDRTTASNRLAKGLRELFAPGLQTNREFLIRVIEHPEFVRGTYHTGFVDENLNELITENKTDDLIAATAAALYLNKLRQRESSILPYLPANYRNNPFRNPTIKLQVSGSTIGVSWRVTAPETYEISCGDWQARVELVSFEPGSIRLSIDGIQNEFRVAEAGDQIFVQSRSMSRIVTRLPRYPQIQGASEHESAYAPMPGQVLKILVEVGQQVSTGDALVILEAMKMEQTLRAAANGVVEAVLVKPGDVVAPGDRLVEIGQVMREA